MDQYELNPLAIDDLIKAPSSGPFQAVSFVSVVLACRSLVGIYKRYTSVPVYECYFWLNSQEVVYAV